MVAVLLVLLVVGVHTLVKVPEPMKGQEKYEELEFVMIHRPQVTYFVDLKFMLCFATLKPDYADLVEFRCPDYLLRHAAGGPVKPSPNKPNKVSTSNE